MAEAGEFHIGVCVTLKSGSPKMVIFEAPREKGILHSQEGASVGVVWFDGGQDRHGNFLIACLNIAPE